VVEDGRLRSAVLLETDARGRPVRLEVATAGGLLTLHPDRSEGALHGNIVTPDGIRHLAFAWSPRHEVLVEGEPLVTVAAAGRLSASLPAGRSKDLPVVRVARTLEAEAVVRRFERIDGTRWRVGAEGEGDEVAVDAEGLPDGLADGAGWPLET